MSIVKQVLFDQTQYNVSDSLESVHFFSVSKFEHLTSKHGSPILAPSVHKYNFSAQAPSTVVIISEQTFNVVQTEFFHTHS